VNTISSLLNRISTGEVSQAEQESLVITSLLKAHEIAEMKAKIDTFGSGFRGTANLMDIKRILKKSTWKGKEVGKLLVHTLSDDFLSNLNPSHKPALTVEEVNSMLAKIKSPNEGRIYNEYHVLYNIFLDLFNTNEAQSQQIHHSLFRLLTFIEGAYHAEHIRRDILKSIPCIMTEQQYDNFIAKKKTKCSSKGVSYARLILDTADYYTKQSADNPKRLSADMKKAIKNLGKKPVTNQRVLSIYNEVMGIGFNELPDGRRQDKMSAQEWERLLDEEYDKGNVFVDKYGNVLSQKAKSDSLSESTLSSKLMLLRSVLEYKGETPEDIEEILHKEMNTIPIAWRVSPTPPQNLTLWDISENIDKLYGWTDNDTNAVMEFFADFQQFYKAIIDELCSIEPLKKKINKLDPKQYFKDFTTWGELADWNVLDYPSKMQEDERYPGGTDDTGIRGFINGVAILKHKPAEEAAIDKDGNYIGLYTQIKRYLPNKLESLKNQEKNIVFARNLFISSAKQCTAYLALMDILADIYDVIEDAEVLKSKSARLVEEKVSHVNQIAASLYRIVKEDDEKRALVRKLFPPIDISEIMPTKGAVEAMRERIANNKNILKDQYPANLRMDIIKMSAEERENAKDTE
jgi:hypothetical protein